MGDLKDLESLSLAIGQRIDKKERQKRFESDINYVQKMLEYKKLMVSINQAKQELAKQEKQTSKQLDDLLHCCNRPAVKTAGPALAEETKPQFGFQAFFDGSFRVRLLRDLERLNSFSKRTKPLSLRGQVRGVRTNSAARSLWR